MKQTNQPREHLGSRLGFILLSAGCAIGIGNVWKFPSVAGANGGGFFVLFYLLFLAIMGIPLMTVEFTLGRAAQKSPVRLYHALAPKKKVWRVHGYLALAGNVILMMYYVSVCAWMIEYFVYMLAGKFEGVSSKEAISSVYKTMLSEPLILILYVAFVVLIGFVVCSFDLQKGIEKISKWMMLALLGIMLFLAINSFTLSGAKEGLAFYLLPNVERLLDEEHNGIIGVIVAAMNQAFFTLSIGIGSMAIFGSFLGKERSLLGESINVAVLDTFVAIVSGLIIFPACYTYGIRPSIGPSLIFEALPQVFTQMRGGRFFGILFFVFMSFAALSTVFAVFQNILSCTQDIFGWSKKKACLIDGVILFFLAIPCVLGFNLLSFKQPFMGFENILSIEDFIVSQILLPLGALIFVLFATNKFGWGWKNFEAEVNQGKGLKVKKWMYYYMKFILPILIFIIFVAGVVTPFLPKT